MIKYYCDLCQEEAKIPLVKLTVGKLVEMISDENSYCINSPNYKLMTKEVYDICAGCFSVIEDTMSKLRVE